jgi:predicted DNA-binding transcriptional regulator AlpA
MRKFSYITVGQILEQLKTEGLGISRITFYKLEKEGLFPNPRKTAGKWRVYDQIDADIIMQVIKDNYGMKK